MPVGAEAGPPARRVRHPLVAPPGRVPTSEVGGPSPPKRVNVLDDPVRCDPEAVPGLLPRPGRRPAGEDFPSLPAGAAASAAPVVVTAEEVKACPTPGPVDLARCRPLGFAAQSWQDVGHVLERRVGRGSPVAPADQVIGVPYQAPPSVSFPGLVPGLPVAC
jgi:hypothetical protein